LAEPVELGEHLVEVRERPPMLAQPAGGSVQQRPSRLSIVLALEPTEQAPLVALEAIEVLMDVGADTPGRPSRYARKYSAVACLKNGFFF
jgi:hypothetical protein